MDQDFKDTWDQFLAEETKLYTRLDKELAYKFFRLGKQAAQPPTKEVSAP